MRARALLAAAASLAILSGCGAANNGLGGGDGGDAALKVVTTTEILADLVHQVGGERVRVSSLVPPGGDPHTYEATTADAARVGQADVTFTNYLLLEQHSMVKAIDANADKSAPNVSLAEASETYGARVRPLVENMRLDVIWLGLRVQGDGKERGATRSSEIELQATKVEGPGELVVYLTQALGDPEIYFNSRDGLDGRDMTTLPPAAHTHLNWAFTKPGAYRLTLEARLKNGGAPPEPIGRGTFAFAVGVDPHTVQTGGKRTILDDGHTDFTVDLDTGELFALTDIQKVGGEQLEVPARQVVVDVPNKAIERVPSDERFRFLGRPDARIFQLPQAVIGKHVHGTIDPHLWQDVTNVKAYVQLIRDTLKKEDPDGAAVYEANTRAYLERLDRLDAEIRARIARIPRDRRQLVTTHDGFAYLADAYDMTVAGFVVPSPGQEPSAEQVRTLTETIRNLRVPAVFLEPNLAHRASVLDQVAEDQGVRVCKLYGDSFDEKARTYEQMMRHNASELERCLGGRR